MLIPITLTPSAAKRIRTIQDTTNSSAVQIALKKGGCAGMEYTFTPLSTIPSGANAVQRDDATLVIDPLVEMFLFGTEIDYNEGLLESGFVFRNPNVKSACGCGASVSF